MPKEAGMFGTQTLRNPAPMPWAASGADGSEAMPPEQVARWISMGPSGRPVCTPLSEQDRIIGVVMHLWWLAMLLPPGPLALGLPIALWLWRRKENPWLDDHGREVLNFAISQLVLTLLLVISFIGWILLPVLWLVGIVSFVRGGIAAGRGEYFRYPITFRFIQRPA